MTLYFEQHTEHLKARRIVFPVDGTDSKSVDKPLVIPFREGWDIQPPQPPAFRLRLRHSAIFPGDASDFNDTATKLVVPGPQGADIVQAWSPPARQIRPYTLSAALARGDDGIQLIFIPPWVQATPRSSFPNIQSNPAAAIPSYNAGPQVGSIFSLPNIINPTLLKASPGTLFSVNVVTAGTTAGGAYDTNVLGGNSVATQICPLPTTSSVPIVLDWPCQYGILLVPGAGQVLSAKWC